MENTLTALKMASLNYGTIKLKSVIKGWGGAGRSGKTTDDPNLNRFFSWSVLVFDWTVCRSVVCLFYF